MLIPSLAVHHCSILISYLLSEGASRAGASLSLRGPCEQAEPFAGRAGKLFHQLLSSIRRTVNVN